MKKHKKSNDIRITVVGDGNVGKTFMLVRYVTNELPLGYEPTIFENHNCIVDLNGKDYNVTLVDTAGQEDYDRLRTFSYSYSDCFLICFAVDSRDSLGNVAYKWAKDIRKVNKEARILLVGTKCDLRYTLNETLKLAEITKVVTKIKAKGYVECSAYTPKGLEHVFKEAVRIVVRKMEKKNRKCTIL